MYAGSIVEQGPVDEIFQRPRHPYTQGLLDAIPTVVDGVSRATGIPGTVPPPDAVIPGCRFAPRCPYAEPACARDDLPLVEVAPDHLSRCRRSNELVLAGSSGAG